MLQKQEVLRQAGAIPYEIVEGQIRVLLVTSRESGRWLIPKGCVDTGLTPAEAAELEAFEEAGIEGKLMSEIPLGFFTYFKKRKSGFNQPATVEVYLLQVEKRLKKWPEMKQRRLGWFSIAEAAELVREPGLARLLWRLEEIPVGA